jgi:hypothetical protein
MIPPAPRRLARAVAVLLALAAAATEVSAGTWDAIERLPGQPPVTVMVDGKPRLYFRVTPERPLVVPVEGPVRLRLTSRVEFAGGKGDLVSYTLKVLEGTREIERQATETAPSSRVKRADEASVGKSRRMTVDVPTGRHELRVVVGGVGAALVRLHQAAPKRGEEPTVSLTPVEAARSVLVVENEKTIPYYSVMAGKPVRLRLVGPARLELITRLDFDPSMRGAHTYRLAISEGGKRLREVEFKTSKAMTASYTNLKDRVPSKFDRLTLPFGEGTHELLIQLMAPAGGAAEIHARIPQPTVGSEE